MLILNAVLRTQMTAFWSQTEAIARTVCRLESSTTTTPSTTTAPSLFISAAVATATSSTRSNNVKPCVCITGFDARRPQIGLVRWQKMFFFFKKVRSLRRMLFYTHFVRPFFGGWNVFQN